MYDLVIRGGEICDGTGKVPFVADIGIINSRIVDIGQIDPALARECLDATEATVSPGFIDFHSHADMAILNYPECHSKIMQGVTTEVIGNCGFSASPVNNERLNLLEKYISPMLGTPRCPWTWSTFNEYLSLLESNKHSPNVAAFVGHGTLRIFAMGFSSNAPSSDEMKKMISALEDSLAAGAIGMSIGLIYAPACYADRTEIEELFRVVARFNKLVAVHMRNESDMLIDSVKEMISIAEATGTRLHISHLKASGSANWGKTLQVLELMDDARARGISITCDQYPYTAGSTTINTLLPQWVLEGGVLNMTTRLRQKQVRDKIKHDYEVGISGWDCLVRANGWENIMVSWVGKDSVQHFTGKTLSQIAVELGKDPADALFDLIVEVEGNASIIVFQQSEDDIKRVMQSGYSVIGSDGLYYGIKPHPRLYGTFARVLGRYVRELKVINLQEAIRKMTSLPANIAGLPMRGYIKKGYYADIVVFLPEQIQDLATYTEPSLYPCGIKYVLVNGIPVAVEGAHTGIRPGKVIKVS